jgi:hypothetical protein
MLVFLDTSAVVKRYVAETGSIWIRALSDPASGHTCRLSALSRVELLAALYRKVRLGTLPLAQAQLADQTFGMN